MSVAAPSRQDQFNPKLFLFDPAQSYPWLVFPQVTVATITFNRLEYTRRMLESIERYAQMPYELLVIDNASEDGTREFLAELAAQRPNLRVVHNRRNVGKGRALLQIRDMLHNGLLVFLDNDVELLSNYWLIHLQKAYHAARLVLGTADVGLGPRLLNCEEYGFRFAHRHEVMPIPTARNAEPRTSYAAYSKDGSAYGQMLDEEVIIGWTDFLHGPIMCMPAALFRRDSARISPWRVISTTTAARTWHSPITAETTSPSHWVPQRRHRPRSIPQLRPPFQRVRSSR